MEADAVGGDPPADQGRAPGVAAPRKKRGEAVGPGRFDGEILVAWCGADSYAFYHCEDNPFRFTTSDGVIIHPNGMRVRGRDLLRHTWPPLDLWRFLPAVIVYDWLYLSSRLAPPEIDAHRAAKIFDEAARTVAAECRLANVDEKLRWIRKAANSNAAAYLWETERWTPEAVRAALPSG